MIVLQLQTTTLDNGAGEQPLEYAYVFEPTVTIPQDTWLSSGSIELVTIVRTTIDPGTSTSGATKFLNPTRQTHGEMALLYGDYVSEQKRLEYTNQMVFQCRDNIAINNTRLDTPLQMSLAAGSQPSHAFSIVETLVCGLVSGLVTPPPEPVLLKSASFVPPGGICLKSFPAETIYIETDRFFEPTANNAIVDRATSTLPTGVSGLLYPGRSMVVEFIVGYRRVSNIAGEPVIPGRIVGAAPFPVYEYSCPLGVYEPAPTNPPCPPDAIQILYDTNGLGVPGCALVP